MGGRKNHYVYMNLEYILRSSYFELFQHKFAPINTTVFLLIGERIRYPSRSKLLNFSVHVGWWKLPEIQCLKVKITWKD